MLADIFDSLEGDLTVYARQYFMLIKRCLMYLDKVYAEHKEQAALGLAHLMVHLYERCKNTQELEEYLQTIFMHPQLLLDCINRRNYANLANILLKLPTGKNLLFLRLRIKQKMRKDGTCYKQVSAHFK